MVRPQADRGGGASWRGGSDSMMTRTCLTTGEARLLLARNRQQLGRLYNRFSREVSRRGAGDGWAGSSEEAE